MRIALSCGILVFKVILKETKEKLYCEQNMAHEMVLRAEIPIADAHNARVSLCARGIISLQAGQSLNFVSHILLAIQRQTCGSDLTPYFR